MFVNEDEEVKTMKPTKPSPETVDQIAQLIWEIEEVTREHKQRAFFLKTLKSKLAKIKDSVDEYVNKEYPMDPKKGPRHAQSAQLSGNIAILNYGKQKDARTIIDQVEALRRLENVREGLGFESMTIALKVLDDELRASEVEDLIRHEYKERRVKAVRIED